MKLLSHSAILKSLSWIPAEAILSCALARCFNSFSVCQVQPISQGSQRDCPSINVGYADEPGTTSGVYFLSKLQSLAKWLLASRLSEEHYAGPPPYSVARAMCDLVTYLCHITPAIEFASTFSQRLSISADANPVIRQFNLASVAKYGSVSCCHKLHSCL